MKNQEIPGELIPDTTVILGSVGPPLPGEPRLTDEDIEIRKSGDGFEAVIKPEAIRRSIREDK